MLKKKHEKKGTRHHARHEISFSKPIFPKIFKNVIYRIMLNTINNLRCGGIDTLV